MKVLLFCLFVTLTCNAISQQAKTKFSHLPVQNGSVSTPVKLKSGFANKMDGVLIDTKNDSCFATEDGYVTSTFKLDDEYAVLIKASGDHFVTYSNLKEIVVKRKGVVKKGTFIGLLKMEEEDYQLLYMISDSRGKILSHAKHIKYLGSNATLQSL